MRQKNAIVGVWQMFAVLCVIELTPVWAQPAYQSVFGKAQILRSTVGPDGSIYVAGTTTSPDFPVTAGALQKTINQSVCYYAPGPPSFPVYCNHGFVAKIDPDGKRLVFATYLSGQRGSSIGGIAVDSEGYIYVGGGATEGFPFTPGTPQSPQWGGFIAKLVPDGSALVYAARVPGSASGIAVDPEGNVYAGGTTSNPEYFTTPGAFQTRPVSGFYEGFVLKLKADGSEVVYSTLLGGTFADHINAIAVDRDGNAYVAGDTASTPFYRDRPDYNPFPTTEGAFSQQGRSWDVFVSKLNPSGTALVYSSLFGGAGIDWLHALAVDGEGHAYFTGLTNSQDFPVTRGAFRERFGLGFAGKFNGDGSSFVYSTFLPGEGLETAVGADGSLFIGGRTSLNDILPTPNAAIPCQTRPCCPPYPYALGINESGSGAHYSSFMASSVIAVSARGHFYLASAAAIFDRIGAFESVEPGIRCVVNAASLQVRPVAPGEIITIYDAGIGPELAAGMLIDNTGKVATSLEGTQVLVGGIAAPLLYVSEGQINAVVPFSVAGPETTIRVERNGAVDRGAFSVPVADAAPGIFTLSESGWGPAVALNQDGTLNSADNPAQQGSEISFFITGAGAMSPPVEDGIIVSKVGINPVLPVQVTITDTVADLVIVTNAPGFVAGTVKVTIRLTKVTSPGSYRMILGVGGRQFSNSPYVTLYIR